MISNPFFLIFMMSSAFFAFFTAILIIKVVIKLFRIKQHRICSILRLIPFFSLMIDLLLSQYSIARWINPLSCTSCLQKLFLELFFPQLKEYLSFHQTSLIDHLGTTWHHESFGVVFIALGASSLFFMVYKLIQAVWEARALYSIVDRASICTRPISNLNLIQMLKKNKVTIYFSNEVQIPLAVYPNIIIIPQATNEILTQEEFVAVIAHEGEHIKHQDPLTRLLSHLIASFFWWVPTKRWIKKIALEQELACDQNVLKYGLNAHSLASALLKVTRQIKTQQAICYFSNSKNSTLVRMQALVGIPKNSLPLIGLDFLGVFFIAFFLLLCVI